MEGVSIWIAVLSAASETLSEKIYIKEFGSVWTSACPHITGSSNLN